MSTVDQNRDLNTFLEACRENTGKHFLDSGGESGRAWQRPAIKVEAPTAGFSLWNGVPDGAVIETGHFLADHLEILHDVRAAYDAWAETQAGFHLELATEFLEVFGMKSRSRDNTYNNENELSQNYIWDVYRPGGDDDSDWVYSDGSEIVIIHIHTGCDVRGGYGAPIFCRSKGDYSAPVDVVCGFSIIDGRDTDGTELTDGERESLSQRWQVGYSRSPWSELSDDVARWFGFTMEYNAGVPVSCIAKLKTGEIVRISVDAPY